MIIIDVLALRNSLLGISLFSFAVSSFTTSYNTMSTVEEKIRTRKENATSGIPYRLSDAYKRLCRTDLSRLLNSIRYANTCIAVCVVISLFSILFKPGDVDKYMMTMDKVCNISIIEIEANKTKASFLYPNLFPIIVSEPHNDEEQLQNSPEKQYYLSPSIDGRKTISNNPDQSTQNQQDNSSVGYRSICIYICIVSVISVVSLAALIILLCNALRIQKIQVSLLELEEEYSFMN